MKPKLRPNIEKFLITLKYIENLIEKKPEIVNDFLNKNELNEAELGIAPLDIFEIIKGTLDLVIEIPDYKFSELISPEDYNTKSKASIAFITTNYLDIPNNGLNADDKEYIIKGLHDFYLGTENDLIPLFNQYNATKHDRIAYSVLASTLFLYTLSVITMAFVKGFDQAKKNNPQQKAIEVPKNIELKPITSKQFSWYTQIEDLSEHLEPPIIKPSEVISEGKKSNPLLDLFEIFKNMEKDIHLDNKALDTHHIQTIFNEIAQLMPNLSLHRRQILTGYIAMNFRIIKEEDYKPRTSSYNSLNSFLNDRVKGVVSNP